MTRNFFFQCRPVGSERSLARIATLMGLAAIAAAPLAATAVTAPPAVNPAPSAAGTAFFEAKVRPVLTARCLNCHTGASAKGKLDLGSREALLRGGLKGTAVVPGDPDKSLLVRAIRYGEALKMPLGTRLADADVQALTEWVRMGAPWPTYAGKQAATPVDARWAFQPVRAPQPPTVKQRDWPRNDIDRFVLADLERNGLKPNRYADRRSLIRRATFDLTGLPATPDEVEAFAGDTQPGAWERVVDRLLASPAYGERWGRHWLDVVRYSDSNGLDWNEVFPNAWRYRDYVIRAFNQDKPYDQFIREQLAGDLLPAASPEEHYQHLVATGMLVMGPKLLAQQDRVQLAMDVADEQIDVTSKAFLGLTVSCARCHDHKFDPIPTKDYYALAGIFKSTETLHGTLPRNNRVMYWMERPLAPADAVAAREAHEAAAKKMQAAITKAKDTDEKQRLTAELKDFQAKAPPAPPMAMAVQDGKLQDVRVHIRGSHSNLGDEVHRGFLTTLAVSGDPVPSDHSGRLELANWIARPDNPLTARVMVNRVWEHHFGRGIVGTPDNFGMLGERPTHPELLDWLAARFAGEGIGSRVLGIGPNGKTEARVPAAGSAPKPYPLNPKPWSLKDLHRLIMLSATYQMSSEPNPAAYAKDPDNRLLWKMDRRRLEAEAIRDAVLLTSGQLDRSAGGSIITKTSGIAGKEFPVDYTGKRRSVYLPVVRGVVYDMFQVFDFADPHVVNGRRDTTTVAPQALFMMNSPFAMEQAGRFADSLLALPGDDQHRMDAAYQRALGRIPSASEIGDALKYVQDYGRELEAREPDLQKRQRAAWQSFCQTLFACSEFRYIP